MSTIREDIQIALVEAGAPTEKAPGLADAVMQVLGMYPSSDLRPADEEDLEREISILRAASFANLGAYAVSFQGHVLTAAADIRPGGGAPIALLLSRDVWQQVGHLTESLGPHRDWFLDRQPQ